MTTAAVSSPARVASRSTPRSVGFASTLASEWLKLSSLRSTRVILGLGLLLSIGTTSVAAFGFGASGADWPEEFDPILFSMVGNIFALIIYSVFGAMVSSREYSGGMIGLTLTATPRRNRVFLAKLVLVAGIVLVFGMLSTTGMFLAGQAILGAYDLPSTTLANSDARWVTFGLGATMPFFAIVGLSLGMLLRSTAGAITTVLGLIWLPQIVTQAMPHWWQAHVISLLPGCALDSFTLGQVVESPEYSDPIVGFVLASAWLLAFVGAASLLLRRRDA